MKWQGFIYNQERIGGAFNDYDDAHMRFNEYICSSTGAFRKSVATGVGDYRYLGDIDI